MSLIKKKHLKKAGELAKKAGNAINKGAKKAYAHTKAKIKEEQYSFVLRYLEKYAYSKENNLNDKDFDAIIEARKIMKRKGCIECHVK